MTVKKGWPAWAAQTFNERPNVFPLGDTRDHVMDETCWCSPKSQGVILVHNSADRREEYETGERKPS